MLKFFWIILISQLLVCSAWAKSKKKSTQATEQSKEQTKVETKVVAKDLPKEPVKDPTKDQYVDKNGDMITILDADIRPKLNKAAEIKASTVYDDDKKIEEYKKEVMTQNCSQEEDGDEEVSCRQVDK